VPALEELSDGQFGYLISQTRNAFFAALEREMQPLGLTASQFVVVIGAMRYRTRTVNDFCQLAGVEPGPMSRLLDRLEAKGIVLRERDLKDRRQVNVTLTEKGAALYPEINARLHKVYATLLNGFSEQEALALKQALEKILLNAGQSSRKTEHAAITAPLIKK
jgi:DNA-binding MarR family transcriptional regulator